MKRARQLSFLPKPLLCHGGELRKGKRKIARPLDPKRPMHIVMRATQARGAWSLLNKRNKARVFVTVHETAERFGVRIDRFANVGHHLHILVLPGSRTGFQNFLRSAAGSIAFFVTGAKKGQALGSRFWDLLAFTRVIEWGREFKTVGTYFAKNLLESLDFSRAEYLLKPLPG